MLLVAALVVVLSGGAYAIYRDSTSNKQAPTAGYSPSAASSAGQPAPQVASSPPPAQGTTAINFLTAFIHPASTATLLVLAGPGATCSMAMQDASHHAVATPGVSPRKTDSRGIVTWSWPISASQPLGSYSIVATCSPGKTASETMVVR